jgi:NhaP-type Na+/H+ or K+/H+ antiporter
MNTGANSWSVIEAVGTISLGLFIGMVARYCLKRFEDYSPKTFGALVAVVLGGAVLGFLGLPNLLRWFYPIGLVGGAALRRNKDRKLIFGLFCILGLIALLSLWLKRP